MKVITFDGRVGKNGAEIKQTTGGKSYVRFSVANNSYSNGETTTEWYDVTSFDENIVNKVAQYITKGRYVIVTGSIKTEVKIGKDNNIWVNHNVRAINIDLPNNGNSSQAQASAAASEPVVSTYTGNTPSSQIVQEEPKIVVPQQTVQEPAPAVVVANNSDDELPF